MDFLTFDSDKKIITISEDNAEELQDCLDAESVQNIGRDYYGGICVFGEDMSPAAIAVYELKNAEEDEDTEAELTYISVSDEESGKTLMNALYEEFEEDDVKRIFFEFEKLSSLEEEFLRSEGFSVKNKEGTRFVETLDDIAAISPLAGKKNKSRSVKSLTTLTDRQYRIGISNALFHGYKGNLEDAAELPLMWFDAEVSSCTVNDGKVSGMYLLHLGADKRLYVDLLFAVGPEYQSDLFNMMRLSLQAAMEKYPGDTLVSIGYRDPKKKALIEKLLPGKSGRKVTAGERDL